jgi:dolichyl-phosphate beta-glucosyltransferase
MVAASVGAKGPHLSLIFPAYNEVRTIGRTLQLAYDYLERQPYDFEILVAADGDDGTREVAREIGAQRGRMKVLGEKTRAGKGRGVRAGVQAAQGTIIGFSDADNKTPIEDVATVLPWFDEGYDLVIGSRAHAKSEILRKQPQYRQIGSRVFRITMHLMTGLWGIGDTQCGFKFFRRAVAHDLFGRQRVDGYMFDVEILALATASGYRIREVPIRWQDDGDSRLEPVAGSWRNAKDLVEIAWLARFERRVRARS